MRIEFGKTVEKEKLGVVARVLLLLLVPFFIVFLWAPERFEIWADENKLSFLAEISSFVQGLEDKIGFTMFKGKKRGFWRNAETPSTIPATKTEEQAVTISEESTQNVVETEIEKEKPKEPEKLQPPIKILIIGDSFVLEGFGPALEEKLLKYQDVTVFRKGYYSTGLTRPDYFDWNSEAKRLIEQNDPNVIIVMFGANDGQTIVTESGKKEAMGTDGWKAEYIKRVDHFMTILEESGSIVFWIGNPIAESDYYSNKMKTINECVQMAVLTHKNVHFVPTWELMADSNGKFAWYLADEFGIMQKMRGADGIHCTYQGGIRMANYVIKQMSEFIELKQ